MFSGHLMTCALTAQNGLTTWWAKSCNKDGRACCQKMDDCITVAHMFVLLWHMQSSSCQCWWAAPSHSVLSDLNASCQPCPLLDCLSMNTSEAFVGVLSCIRSAEHAIQARGVQQEANDFYDRTEHIYFELCRLPCCHNKSRNDRRTLVEGVALSTVHACRQNWQTKNSSTVDGSTASSMPRSSMLQVHFCFLAQNDRQSSWNAAAEPVCCESRVCCLS